MITLILIGLVGGLITSVSPCVLPMLPIVFFATGAGEQSEGDRGKRDWRPVIIIAGLATGFSVITLLGTTLLSLLGLPDDFLRWAGVVLLAIVGLGMIVPALGHLLERPFYRLPKVTGTKGGPFLLGLGLGTLYVPCAGPVLAAITVAGATGEIGLRTVVLTVAFAVGASVPLLIFAAAGTNIRARIQAFRSRATAFRTIGGVVLLGLAVGLLFNLPQVLQKAVPNYTAGVEKKLAENTTLQGALAPYETEENKQLSRCTPGDDELADCGPAPKLRGTGRWFNTNGDEPSLSDLRGKVVLLDFFAYSCINCQRDQPYIEKWAKTYEDSGLTVLGVHSPEFAFEKNAGNLADSLKKEGTTYPVVQDNDLATWTAYRNRYWPAKYLIDRDGTVRAITFGEGDYDRTESLLRELLAEDGQASDLPDPVTDVSDPGLSSGRTPELYLADNRPGYVGKPKYLGSDAARYTFTGGQQPLNSYGLSGTWTATNENLTAGPGGAKVRLHFKAANVYHVLEGKGTVTVSRPGHPARTVKVDGTPNLYPIVEGDDVVDETVTLTYSTGITAYTFTFG